MSGLSAGVELRKLLPRDQVVAWRGDQRLTVRSLCADSRRAAPGAAFFAFPGTRTDGNLYVEEALGRGVVAVVSEQPAGKWTPGAHVQVKNLRTVVAAVARAFFREPDAEMGLLGMTGTNGKTTVSFLLQHLLTRSGQKTGMIGTVHYDLGERRLPAYRTTPEAIELWGLLGQMRDNGCRLGVLEVSSHGIAQGRVRGMHFAAGAFLNLTQDHLDYHGTMEDYFAAKRAWFTGESGAEVDRVAIGMDDPWGRKLTAELSGAKEVFRFGREQEAELRAEIREPSPVATRVAFSFGGNRREVVVPLPGVYNVDNALAALSLGHLAGFDPLELAGHLEDFPGVPGRMERVSPDGLPFTVLVDYAHTSDALRNALRMLRSVAEGRLLVVFGCGGNRDRQKRPLMTQAVLAEADQAWATADNPRKEALGQIFADMRKGLADEAPLQFVEDRRQAISVALDAAGPGDVVLIAGKGHESFQELADTVIPFDDRQTARQLLGIKQGSLSATAQRKGDG